MPVIPDLTARDVHVSGVGAARPLETVAPVSGAVQIHTRRWCSDSEDSDDDVLPVGALIPLDIPTVCYAQLDDFGWEVPDCVPGMLMSEQDSDVEWMELTQDVLPDVFPVVSAEVAAVPWPLPAVDLSVPQAIFEREAAPLVVSLSEAMSVRVMSGQGMKVGLTGLTRDIQVLPLCRCPCMWSLRQSHRMKLGGIPLCQWSP